MLVFAEDVDAVPPELGNVAKHFELALVLANGTDHGLSA